MSTPRATPAGSHPAAGVQRSPTSAPPRPAGAEPIIGSAPVMGGAHAAAGPGMSGPVRNSGAANFGSGTSVKAPESSRADATPRRGKGQRRPPRLASLQLKRVDPWTVLKISLIVAIVMFFVWMIAVGVLYLSLGSMDVWTKVNSTWQTLTAADSGGTSSPLVTPGVVFGVTAVIGAINIVLFTALATIAAFVYNAAAGMSGGVEITLGERD